MDIEGILSTQAIATSVHDQAMSLNRGRIAALAWPCDFAKVASEVASTPAISKQDRSGVLGHSFVTEQIYERIWVTPSEIEAGFIADQKDYKISIWNAFQSSSKEITDIDVENQAGTMLIYGSLPILLPPNGEEIHDLYILKPGPATQETIYFYEIDGNDYVVEISGQRIVPFPHEPNWSGGIKLAYNFQTVVTRARTHKEQRRPMLDRMFREESATFVFLDYLEATKAQNRLAYGHGKVLGIPIYTEPIIPSSGLFGNTVISTLTSLAYLWNLQNLTDFVIIIDFVNYLYEVKELQAIGVNSLTFKKMVSVNLDKDSSTIYPIFLSSLESMKFTHHSGYDPEISEYQATFKELVNG